MRRPTIAAGARVALVAPAGPLSGEADLQRAQENARSFGWVPVVGEHVLAREGYLAGLDGQRLADLNQALTDDAVDAVWCVRGGYGMMRVIDQIDYAALRRRPKPIIGYSDVTAFHAALATRCEVVSYHGPTARASLTAFSRDSLQRALSGGDSCGTASNATTLHPGHARGRLVGGNLAILCALMGTPYEPDYRDAMLVVEDVNEAVYRIDRMLTQLRLAGRLAACRGIVFGQFSDVPTDEPEERLGARTLDDVLREVAVALRVPCIAGAPVGHVADQWTLPLGADAELDADARTLRILQ
ncbi:MAG TPA: LD-carboxypeptidase [Gemmatimonadaceae bacterium]|jgi:muramoyltetrapeptide carboxypeptidase